MHTYMFWNPKYIGVKWFEFQYASDIWIMNHRITYKMLNWIRIRQWTNNKRILHSLINEELRQIFDTGLEIFSINVIFPVQIFNFLCVYAIKMKKLNYLVKPHERFQFGFSFTVNDLLQKKSNLQHCQHNILLKNVFLQWTACFHKKSLHQIVT